MRNCGIPAAFGRTSAARRRLDCVSEPVSFFCHRSTAALRICVKIKMDAAVMHRLFCQTRDIRLDSSLETMFADFCLPRSGFQRRSVGATERRLPANRPTKGRSEPFMGKLRPRLSLPLKGQIKRSWMITIHMNTQLTEPERDHRLGAPAQRRCITSKTPLYTIFSFGLIPTKACLNFNAVAPQSRRTATAGVARASRIFQVLSAGALRFGPEMPEDDAHARHFSSGDGA